MMVAYAAARTAAPGHLVLYRVGEFYEVLLDDAVVVSRALGIQLTRRRQKDAADASHYCRSRYCCCRRFRWRSS